MENNGLKYCHIDDEDGEKLVRHACVASVYIAHVVYSGSQGGGLEHFVDKNSGQNYRISRNLLAPLNKNRDYTSVPQSTHQRVVRYKK